MDTVGQRIKNIRKMRGWTQKETAEKAGIHLMLLQKYEYGSRKPKPDQLQKIAAALEVDISFLQPSTLDTPFSLLAFLYDLVDEHGKIIMEQRGGTVLFGISHLDHPNENIKLTAALNACQTLSPEEFKKWLINYPPLIHNGKIVER